MKKVLALVLAFVMVAGLATVAMAKVDPLTDDKPIILASAYKISSKGALTAIDLAKASAPGTTFYFPISIDGSTALTTDQNTLDYYRVNIEETNENTKVLDSVKIVSKKIKDNGGSSVVAEDKTSYFVEVKTKNNMSLDDQELDLKVILKAINTKADKGGDSAPVTIAPVLGYEREQVSEMFGLGNNKYIIEAEDNTSEKTDVDMFLGDNDAHFETKMYKQPDFFIAVNEDVDDKYVDLYPDAALTALNVTMPKALKQAGTLYIPAAMTDEDKAPHLYEEKDGKLVEIKNAYDKDEEEFVLKNLKSIGKYLISDIDLEVKASEGGNEANPETGANDVVAIAAGLAVVSLVAAGAVSLKK